jgi:hypothetical protein
MRKWRKMRPDAEVGEEGNEDDEEEQEPQHDNKDGGDKPMPRRVVLCGTYGCTLPDKHRGLHQFPQDGSRRKRSKPDWSQLTRRKCVKFEPGPEPDGEPEDDFGDDDVEDEDEDEDDVEDEDDEEDAGDREEGGEARETRAPEETLTTTSVRSPRKAAAEATVRVAALAGLRPASSPPSAAATGPATCERCAKAAGGAPPDLLCFARVSERCRAQAGRVTSTARWHHVSRHEHFCHDCVEHYGRGEARRVWQSQQAHGKCSFKELVVRMHLPNWARCMRPECAKWRRLPAHAQPWLLPERWHCSELDALIASGGLGSVPATAAGLASSMAVSTSASPFPTASPTVYESGGLAASRSRRRSPQSPLAAEYVVGDSSWAPRGDRGRSWEHRGCDVAEEPAASLPAPPEEPGQPIEWIAGGASEAEVREAVEEARLPWWDLSRKETAAVRGTALETAPSRFVALRNFLLWLWRARRASGWLSRAEALRALGGAGLSRLWYSAMLPLVHSMLERLGEINFGATTRLTLRIPRPAWAASARKTIVVIGAGLAGLGAAEQLRRLGHQVIMLEAH